MNSWRDFIHANLDTIGVSAVFAALGSGFMLKSTENVFPITFTRTIMVLVAGQLVGVVAASALLGYFGWSIFLAPGIGALSGLVGIFILRGTIKAGEKAEDRGSDIGNAIVDRVAKRTRGDDNG